jgi:Methylamine utilisation protein MauE
MATYAPAGADLFRTGRWGVGWLILRLVLAATFAVAAVAKLCSPGSTRASLRSFGVPEVITSPLALGLSGLELAVAAALSATPVATAGAWVAVALLVTFTAVTVAARLGGRRPTCNCFGPLGSQPAGAGTLARNGLLGAAALVAALGGPGESTTGVLAKVPVGAIVAAPLLVFALGALGVMTVQLWQQNGRLLARVVALEVSYAANPAPAQQPIAGHGPLLGSPAPDFMVWDENDGPCTLADLLTARRPVVLAFTDPDCLGCRAVKPMVDAARRAGVQVAVITRGDRQPVPGVLRQLDREVMAAYRAHVVPSAVVVDADGRIASELARGPEAVAGLLGSAAPLP